MKRLFNIVVMVLFCAAIQAQYNTDGIPVDSLNKTEVSKKSKFKKLDPHLTADMSYMYSSSGFHGPMYSLSPSLSYPLGKRFFLTAGLSAGFGTIYSNFPSSFSELNGTNVFRSTIYARGSYLVNDRLVVSGSAYRSRIDVPNMVRTGNENQSDYEFNGMSVGFNYKLTPNITFGAEIHIDSPGSNYYNGAGNPYSNPFYSPMW